MKIVFRCDPALPERPPRPLPAAQTPPDRLREMPGLAFSDRHGRDVRTVRRCPPFIDAMRHGFVMRSPCDDAPPVHGPAGSGWVPLRP
jgi:hypothetical protein